MIIIGRIRPRDQMVNLMPSFYSEICHSRSAFSLLACEFLALFLQSAQQAPLCTSSESRVYRVVCAPSTELLLNSHHKGQTSTNRSERIFPFSPSAFISRINSVLTTPGCRLATTPLFPTFSASASVNSTLQSLDREQETLASQSRSKLMFSQSGLGSPPNPSSLLCAREDTLMILNWAAAEILPQRREVRQKWPRWLTPHCISKPSLVVLLCGSAIMPALLTRQSTLGKGTLLAKASMELRLARSSDMNSTLALGCSFLMDLMTSSAVSLLLAPMITSHPSLLSSLTVSAPMPELPPVTTAYLPVRSTLGEGNCVPRKQCLMARRSATRTEVMSSICWVLQGQEVSSETVAGISDGSMIILQGDD